MPKEMKDIVLLRYFEGKSIKETAEVLKIPPGTVSTRQRKALELLQRELAEVAR